jgi:ATP-binding cassette subfamily B protein
MMDRILVFDRGRIVEDGTHEELLKINGIYKRLWSAQIKGEVTNQVEGVKATKLF